MPCLTWGLATLVIVTFAMLSNPTREGGFMPGELAAPEDRPVASSPRVDLRRSNSPEARTPTAPTRARPSTDRDYWRWHGRIYIGDRVVAP